LAERSFISIKLANKLSFAWITTECMFSAAVQDKYTPGAILQPENLLLMV
jgi:hypothetical protein